MSDDAAEAHAAAIRAVESEFAELFAQFRRVILSNADRVSSGMLPGAYKVFTTIVKHGPITASAMAERLMIDKGQLSRMVRELEELRLVTRTPDPNDGRAHLLETTDEGRRRLEAARSTRDDDLHRAMDTWPVEDVERFAEYLRALGRREAPRA